MTLLVTLKPPVSIGGSNIDLNAERIDYTVLNDVQQKLTGTKNGRAWQKVSSMTQMTITGVCINENGNTAYENIELIETAINTWGFETTLGDNDTYPKLNWRLGDEKILLQKLTYIDEGNMDPNNDGEINYILTMYKDTRV